MAHAHHHGHSHAPAGRSLLVSILLNIVITVAQIIGGLISGSLALLSDAVHNFSDVISLMVSYIAHRVVGKDADFSKTFGYKRAEIIAAFINAGGLIVIALILIKEAVGRFFEPPVPIESSLVIWLAIVAIVGNGFSALLIKMTGAKNMNFRSSYLHLMTDMYTSVAVLIGGILMKFFQVYWVDSLLTFIIGAYLIYVGYDLLKSSFKVLMLFSPKDIEIRDIVKSVTAMEPVKNIHHIHIWMLNENEVHLEAHIEFTKNISLLDFNGILVKIEQLLLDDFGINHVNIQPEFQRNDPKDIIVQD